MEIDGKEWRGDVAPCRRRQRSATHATRRVNAGRIEGGATRPFRRRAASYISCRDPANGPASLEAQMRMTDAAAARLPAMVTTRYIDSGSPVDESGIGHALERLAIEAAAGTLDVVIVEHVSRFASDYAAALRFAVELTRFGVRIIEAGGGSVRRAALEARNDFR